MNRRNSNENSSLSAQAQGDLFGHVAPAPENVGISSRVRGKYSCVVCGAETLPGRKTCSASCRAKRLRELGRASYCRMQARQRAVAVTRICAECGVEFTATNPQGPINKTCSQACRTVRWKRQTREYALKAPPAQLSCRACGHLIERREAGPGRQPGFCSETCRYRIKLADARAARARMRHRLANRSATATKERN